MKLAHCPRCIEYVALVQFDIPGVTLKHMRRAHVDHMRPRTSRRLIHNGRKP